MSEPRSDEIKRKFREALDRKNHQQSNSAAHLDGQSKVHDAHGSAEHKREFRRKSG
ncbi:DUF5302 domain-containing protein [Prescottella defluvii]|uniref:DUF5302 domain-containing protein n=1 Tax=Prescottella defluvii TaxID=1323361 RepID=UPI000ABB44B0|nr:DUF5302 domain-containing protein [Prescottella defluvii]